MDGIGVGSTVVAAAAGAGALRADGAKRARRVAMTAYAALGRSAARFMVALDGLDKETEKKPDPVRFLLIRRSGGSDRTLPPSVRSIPERSKSPGIATKRSLSPVNTAFVFSTRPDAEKPSDRTLKGRVQSLLRSKFTSYELTGRWTSESGAAPGHSFSSKSSKSFVLPIPNQVPTPIRSK